MRDKEPPKLEKTPDMSTQTNTEDAKSEAIDAAEEIREAVAEKADDLKRVAVEQADRMKEAALEKGQDIRDMANEKVDSIKNYAEENLGISGDKIDDLKAETERYVKENPVKSVFIALGLGFVIGRILK